MVRVFVRVTVRVRGGFVISVVVRLTVVVKVVVRFTVVIRVVVRLGLLGVLVGLGFLG